MTPRRQDLRRVGLCCALFAAGLVIVWLTGCSLASASGKTTPARIVAVCPHCGATNVVMTTQRKVTVRSYSLFEKADVIVASLRVVAAQSGSVAVGVTGLNASADAQLPAVVDALGPLIGAAIKAALAF